MILNCSDPRSAKIVNNWWEIPENLTDYWDYNMVLQHPHLYPFETLFPLWIKADRGEDSLCLILSNPSQLTGIFTFEYSSVSGGIKNATTPQGNFQVSIISTRLWKQRIDKVNYILIIMLSCSVYIVIATVPRDSITHNAFPKKKLELKHPPSSSRYCQHRRKARSLLVHYLAKE